MRFGVVDMYEDNKESIKLNTKKYPSRRIKYTDAKHHLVRDVRDGQRMSE